MPGLGTLAPRAAGEILPWMLKGAPLTEAEVLAARALACEGDETRLKCTHWDGKAWLGIGRCTHRLCGCSKWKRHLATAKCPMGKWPVAKSDTPPQVT